MGEITDWKGNEIKVGMTIYFVQTKPGLLESSRMGLLMPHNGETVWEDEQEWLKRKNKEVWELGEPMEVVNQMNRLCVLMKYENDPDVESVIFPIVSMFGELPTIAIKGISDTNPHQ